jgi:SAM-dependent methyltransferase
MSIDTVTDCRLAQRGRALIDFEVGVRQGAGRLQAGLERTLAARGVTPETLPDDMDARHRRIDETLADQPALRTRALLGEWSAREHGRVCEEAFDEVREQVAPTLDALAEGPTTITEHDFTAPRYWSEVWFHRTRGGWDASEYNGFVHGALVHRKYVARVFPGDIYGMRRRVLDELPRHDHRRILELGTSSGHYTVALSERYPEAEIVGVDLSPRMLEQARRVGNALGHAWQLHVLPGEATGFADASFDLVTSYAIHHELPPKIITQWFEEAFRLLAPGGDLLMIDVPRYADLDKLAAWRFDWAAKWGGEPFWRPSAMLDFAEGARAAGFVDVRAHGIGPGGNPYLVYGRKPGEADRG